MDWERFRVSNWETMSSKEKAAWLYKYGLNETIYNIDDTFLVFDEEILDVTAQLIYDCEQKLTNVVRQLYVSNVTGEVSALAYKNIDTQLSNEDRAKLYYSTMLMAPLDVRGRCLYWAIRGEKA